MVGIKGHKNLWWLAEIAETNVLLLYEQMKAIAQYLVEYAIAWYVIKQATNI